MKQMPFLLLVLLFGFAQNGMAQKASKNILFFDEADAVFQASIEEVAWIAGIWKGKALGGEIEEIWSKPLGGSMMGSFKLVSDGQVNFYELCTITEEKGSLLLRIKHFNKDLKGWEEKDKSVSFRLVKLEPKKAYFDGLTFELVGKNTLHVSVIIGKGGQEKETLFAYRRQ